MNEYKQFNFTNILYQFRAKNGTVILNRDDQIYIRRVGWFDTPYQFFTRGPVLFKVEDIDKIVIKEPGLMRGYMDFILHKGHKARVWLTQPGYMPYAEHMRKTVEERMKKIARNGLSKTDRNSQQ